MAKTRNDRSADRRSDLDVVCVGSAQLDAHCCTGSRDNDSGLFCYARSFAGKTKWPAVPCALFPTRRAAAGLGFIASRRATRLSTRKYASSIHRRIYSDSFYRQHASDHWSRRSEPFISKAASLSGRGYHAANNCNDCPGRRRFLSACPQQSSCLCGTHLASRSHCLVRSTRAETVSERRVSLAFWRDDSLGRVKIAAWRGNPASSGRRLLKIRCAVVSSSSVCLQPI